MRVFDRTSQLSVELSTDLAILKDVDSISVTVAGPSGTSLYELGPAGLQLPDSIFMEGIIFAADQTGLPPDRKADVTVTAWKGVAPITVTRAVGVFPYQEGWRVMRMSLSWLCAGTAREVAPGRVESTCPSGQSCRAGVCRSEDRTAETLPVWDPQHRPACFDIAKCMASAPSVSVDLATCTVSMVGATNFAVVKPPGTQGVCTPNSCLVPLSNDPVEGWTVIDGKVALPPAVCGALNDGRATAVTASSVCPTWSPDQRPCGTTP